MNGFPEHVKMFLKFGTNYLQYPYVLDFLPIWAIEQGTPKIQWLNENVGKENYNLDYNGMVPYYVMFVCEEYAMAFKMRWM